MTYVFSIQKEQLEQFLDFYQDSLQEPKAPHVLAFISAPDLTITVFSSLKVSLQGKNAYEDYLMWSAIFDFEPVEKEITVQVALERKLMFLNESTIGSDEVGTGDFYGPVVVCAAFVERSQIDQIRALGVADSKKLNDEVIQKIAHELEKYIQYHVLVLPNPKYNELVNEGFNLNKIKAYLHNHAILKLKQSLSLKVDRVIIDEFCSKKLYFEYLKEREYYSDITFLQKAEDQSISVACASILARNRFLQEMEKLSSTLGILLPKGASIAVDMIGKRIALEKGFEIFKEIAKVHFKNYDKIKELMNIK